MFSVFVINGKKILNLILLICAVILILSITYFNRQNLSLFTFLDQKTPSAIYNVKTDQKKVALTFDISWGDQRTEPILDILEEKDVKKVTFFLSSPWAETHPEIVKRIVDLGFEIGSHGHKHVNYSNLTEPEIREQIQKADEILTKITGKKVKLLRTPNGDFDKRVLKIANDLGYTVIQWDTDSRDWMNPGVDQIINRVMKNVHPGDIILMHASDSCKQTHQALPIIIDRLRQEGYELVTVSELIANINIETNPID